jgi:uncharacterized metal-binding protein YceD (DUF177 family)
MVTAAFAGCLPSAITLHTADSGTFTCQRTYVVVQPSLRPSGGFRSAARASADGGTNSVSKKSTARRKPSGNNSPPRGLFLDRRDIEDSQGGSKFRGVRLSRDSTLGNIGVVDEGGNGKDTDERVLVSIAIQPVGDDFRLFGRVKTNVLRNCDRCCSLYSEPVNGETFEVFLDSGDGLGDDRDAEAVEDFAGPRARVDLSPHVRDAVVLGLPSKASCGDGCVGLIGPQSGVLDDAGRLMRIRESDGTSEASGGEEADDRSGGTPSMDALLALKKKLEQR